MDAELKFVWIFNGAPVWFPGGIFSTRAVAEEWIAHHKLSGVLTRYPVDVGAFDWAVENQLFRPKKEFQSEPEFIGRFSSASFEHYHYENGCGGFFDEHEST